MGRAPRKGDLGCRETSPGLSLRAGLSTSNKPNTSQKNSSRSEATQELLFLSRRGNVEAWKHRPEPPVLEPGEPSETDHAALREVYETQS